MKKKDSKNFLEELFKKIPSKYSFLESITQEVVEFFFQSKRNSFELQLEEVQRSYFLKDGKKYSTFMLIVLKQSGIMVDVKYKKDFSFLYFTKKKK